MNCEYCGASDKEYELGKHLEGLWCCRCVVDHGGGWEIWHGLKGKTGMPPLFKKTKEEKKEIKRLNK